ncbi:DUF2155 domain-containing protein [Yunchengibacter salinarum]|uniref:DUF2155 domain-containing protein n=1 Tax=Yunchengibacter salinarum TaxID=3133399 RepID=UPI0035B616C8
MAITEPGIWPGGVARRAGIRPRFWSRPARAAVALALLLSGWLILAPMPGLMAQDAGISRSEPDALPAVPAEQPGRDARAVVLRALDKITARTTEIVIPVGESRSFGTLTIKARYCRSRPPIEPPETFAYLTITDSGRRNEAGAEGPVFQGWMMASSPGLHGLEHPVYDVWVLRCKMADGSSASG